MTGYTKLFGSILESTVWLESPPIKVVWITLLAMAGRDGHIEASVPGLAKRAGVERGHCEQALAVFLAPDPDSRTTEYEGRRIAVVPGGWRLLNYEFYRHRASADEARIKAAERKRRERERKRASIKPSHIESQNTVTGVTLPGRHDIAPAPAAEIFQRASAADGPSPSAPDTHTGSTSSSVNASGSVGAGGGVQVQRRAVTGSGVMAGALPRDHLRHAHCGRVCVPDFLHAEFLPKLSGDADARLKAFYIATLAAVPEEQDIGDEPPKFWRAHFARAFGVVAPTGQKALTVEELLADD